MDKIIKKLSKKYNISEFRAELIVKSQFKLLRESVESGNINKDLIKAGLQINGDTSVISRSHLETIKEIENSITKGDLKKFPQLKDRLIGAVKWWETGLFDGVYRETQLYIAEKQVIPQ